ncbi:MAG: cytochrome c [Rhodoferax sp.]|uniref:c-type cytochrome n=1 Tax=Rhodoferax sp. TaxID=50421 RepID=UPI00262F1AAA|nr:cytochrome c [Rhodoferax sp.]MDD2879296.1 cytochrome c [Rhodoferax sp.]
MKLNKTMVQAGVLACITQLGGTTFAQSSVDFGKNEYLASCASCHGVSGKGDGAMKVYLTKPATDLTRLARDNGGVFPNQRLWEVIDGRAYAAIGSHGAREMPVWGYIYRAEDTQPSDLHARNRITSLLDYLARIQEK